MTREIRLKDLGRWSSGGTPPKDREDMWAGDVPWLSAKDIDRDRLREPTAFITEAGARDHSRVVPPGSILVIVRGMALVHGLPVVMTDRRVAFNQDLRALEVAPDLEPRFVYYALRGHRHRLDAHIDRAAHGTARVTDSVYGERVPVFARHKQAQIADFLDRECGRIGELAIQLEAVRQRAAELSTHELAERVAGAKCVRLKHLGYAVTQGWSPDAWAAPPSDGELGVLRLSAVSGGTFRPDDAKALSPDLESAAVQYLLKEGDLLLVRASGSLALLGQAAIVTGLGSRRLVYPDLIYRLDQCSSHLPRRLVLHLMRTPLGQAALTAAKRGAANNKLRIEDVRNLALPDVPSDAVLPLLALVEASEARHDEFRAALASLQSRLAEYRDALITEAVTGKLDIARLSEPPLDESAQAAIEGEQPEVLVT